MSNRNRKKIKNVFGLKEPFPVPVVPGGKSSIAKYLEQPYNYLHLKLFESDTRRKLRNNAFTVHAKQTVNVFSTTLLHHLQSDMKRNSIKIKFNFQWLSYKKNFYIKCVKKGLYF